MVEDSKQKVMEVEDRLNRDTMGVEASLNGSTCGRGQQAKSH
jgi:hypothetical protein